MGNDQDVFTGAVQVKSHVGRSAEPCRMHVSAAWNELDMMMMMDEVDAKS